MNSTEYKHLLSKAREAWISGDRVWGSMSVGEKLAVALICNRCDWLRSMDYTIIEAMNRVGPDWVAFMRPIENELKNEYGPAIPD